MAVCLVLQVETIYGDHFLKDFFKGFPVRIDFQGNSEGCCSTMFYGNQQRLKCCFFFPWHKWQRLICGQYWGDSKRLRHPVFLGRLPTLKWDLHRYGDGSKTYDYHLTRGRHIQELLLLQQGKGQVWVQHSDFWLETCPPPSHPLLSSRGILKRCWKQMVTGSHPARSLGNLYSAYQNPIMFPGSYEP